MRRRSFMIGALGMVAPSSARAASGCVAVTPQGPLCRVFIQAPEVIRQQCPQWCWAASAAMIFAMEGHTTDQKTIVQRVFGQLACLPSSNILIANLLSAQWEDDDGDDFQVAITAAYDFRAGINAITDDFIVNELKQERPLLYGNDHHAMVLSQVDFIETPHGPIIQSVGVFDPFPISPAFHLLTPPEMIPAHLGGCLNFLAAASIG